MKRDAENAEGESVSKSLYGYPLLDALIGRRSRRFGHGMKLNGGPLVWESTKAPEPLSEDEEAALAFAASGVTGYALAELPYETGTALNGDGGNIMKQFVGRTAPSADALHTVIVFYTNDSGTWMLRRPPDFARPEIAELVQGARTRRLREIFEQQDSDIEPPDRCAPRITFCPSL